MWVRIAASQPKLSESFKRAQQTVLKDVTRMPARIIPPMTLAAGTRLGSYEVSTLLGAGGMGEVYRARDPRLGRDVAIKVLPAAFAADPDRLRRFEQEARAAATISHPNILVVYDVGVFHPPAPSEASGFGNDARPSSYLVSELLDGETLAARLRRGPLTVRRAVEFVVQIAHGLAAAHEKGILHRDLKPANIFVTTDERAKILDFGLAKLTESPEGTGELSLLTATVPGVVLGTVGYMSPEQVRGQTIDQRSDIFAVGVLLFEMLSGRRAFPGNTAADAVSAILAEDRPRLPASERQIPATLVRIVDRCLEKAPAARFQTATDLAFALEGLLSASDHAPSSSPAPGKPRLLPWLVATTVLCLVALGLTAILYLRGPADEDAVFHSTILPPGELSVSLSPHFSLSPNGRLLAMIAPDPSHRRMLWIRPLDGPAAQALAGTEDAEAPFWSPDSRTVAFVADGRLKRIDAAGGPVVTVAESAFTAPGTWNRDDVILFTARQPSTLSRVRLAGRQWPQQRLQPPAMNRFTPTRSFFLTAVISCTPPGLRPRHRLVSVSDRSIQQKERLCWRVSRTRNTRAARCCSCGGRPSWNRRSTPPDGPSLVTRCRSRTSFRSGGCAARTPSLARALSPCRRPESSCIKPRPPLRRVSSGSIAKVVS